MVEVNLNPSPHFTAIVTRSSRIEEVVGRRDYHLHEFDIGGVCHGTDNATVAATSDRDELDDQHRMVANTSIAPTHNAVSVGRVR